jgi:hypothetical protein
MISGWAGGGVRMLVAVLDDLIDVMGENEDHPLASLMEVIGVLVENEDHPLASLMEVIGVLVEKYEDKYIPELTEI